MPREVAEGRSQPAKAGDVIQYHDGGWGEKGGLTVAVAVDIQSPRVQRMDRSENPSSASFINYAPFLDCP
jgi:hypothetical protein